MRKLLFSITTVALVLGSVFAVMTIQKGQAQARATCLEQADQTLSQTALLLNGKRRKITLDNIDSLLNTLNQSRHCMNREQKAKTRDVSKQLGIERAVLLFDQPRCSGTNIPVDGCTPDGWPTNKRVPRIRLVKNPGF